MLHSVCCPSHSWPWLLYTYVCVSTQAIAVQAVKDAGKYRQEGKNYEVKDKDIIFFKFNVTADAKKK